MSVPPPNASKATEAAPPPRRRWRRPAVRLRREGPSPWAFLRDFRRVLPYVRPHRRLAAGSLAMVGVSAVVTLLSPWPLAILIDSVLGDKPLPSVLGVFDGLGRYQLLAVAVVAGLLVTGLEHGLAVVDNYVNTKLDQNMVLDLRSDMFRHAQRLSLAWHDNKRTGMLMYQINNQAAAVGSVTVSLPPVLQSVLTLGGMFIVVFKIEATLALVALTVVPFIYYSAGYYARRIQPRVLRVRNLEGQSLTLVHEAMAMLRVIIAFGREDHEHRRFLRQGRRAVDARVDLTVRQTLFSLVVTMTTAIGTALVLGFGAWYVLQHRMTTGELIVVMGYIAALYKPLEQISHTVSSLQQQFISLRNALDLLDTRPEIVERPDAVALGPVAGEVAYEGVYFGYPGRPGTLKNVSFTAPAGARVAVVGPTGAGKSTLLHLLPRFYDPQHGRVLVDGHDLREVRLDGLRDQISIVHQEPLLFADTIRANIAYGRLDATEAEIVAAAQAANAHDFITALPQGYETEIGERGAQLSGGERQRISVARAFLKDAPILILDEPTSAIDSRTEAVILEALERLMEGRTTFMVAHRLSTVRDADLILVVNGGRIVEHGTHGQLLALGGLYAELHDAQLGAPRRAAAAVSADGLSELTSAIAEGRQGGLAGPALAELARAMADGAAADGQVLDEDAVWLLTGAVWPLLHDGSADALRRLAAVPAGGGAPPLAAQLARRMLADLGLDGPADARAVALDRREAA
jgi:ATP-binding cassette subfamily B protein/subfamily B ATP-binding cassette protein MsbA